MIWTFPIKLPYFNTNEEFYIVLEVDFHWKENSDKKWSTKDTHLFLSNQRLVLYSSNKHLLSIKLIDIDNYKLNKYAFFKTCLSGNCYNNLKWKIFFKTSETRFMNLFEFLIPSKKITKICQAFISGSSFTEIYVPYSTYR